MVPTPVNLRSRSPGFLYSLASLAVNHLPKLAHRLLNGPNAVTDATHTIAKREEKHDGKFIAFAILIPVLVLLSGLFAGLTLGYMSLDETQLHVLSISGTAKQKEYAKKIEPIRKNGHLLLVTLLLANMIVNETLPVISSPVLGGGAQSVVVSTVLIVIFSEIIPQSLCTRYGLAIGANMAGFVRVLIFALGIIAWPVAKLLEFVLGSHHGIMYRRAELKELIAMHATNGELGGDLKTDTVTIIGAALDMQEKIVRQAMTPIDKVFMLNINCVLDYDTMRRISDTGHSRVPVFEEIEVPLISDAGEGSIKAPESVKAKKIVGLLLVKQCLMLDPKDATPLRKLQLHRHQSVPNNMSLLAILDRFQEGRSHMAIVSRFSVEKAASVKRQVKKGLTQRLMAHVGMGDSSGSDTDTDTSDSESEPETDGGASQGGSGSGSGSVKKKSWKKSFRRKRKAADVEKGEGAQDEGAGSTEPNEKPEEDKNEPSLPQSVWAKLLAPGREQNMPDDAVLAKEDAKDLLKSFDANVAPVGIITLEDVLEELIGEEIYDEFDHEGQSHLKAYVTKPAKPRASRGRQIFSVTPAEDSSAVSQGERAGSKPGSESTPIVKSISTPASPNLSQNAKTEAIARTGSLGQSISALASLKKQRQGDLQVLPRASSVGPGARREGPQQLTSRSEPDIPGLLAPRLTVGRRISDVLEDSEDALRIPGPQERSGPDISGGEEKEKEKEE